MQIIGLLTERVLKSAHNKRGNSGTLAIACRISIVEYYLFRNLPKLMNIDPGMFPKLVLDALCNGMPQKASMSIRDCYGVIKVMKALLHSYQNRKIVQISILFHLNVRTLLFALITRYLNPNQKIIVKADMTATAKIGIKTLLVWRLIDKISMLIVCETPEALSVLRTAGIQRAEFVPNDIGSLPTCVSSDDRKNGSIVYDFLFVTREGDSRKSPELTKKIACTLAGLGFQVACIGIHLHTSINGLTAFASVSREFMFQMLLSSAIYTGLSKSESFWFLVAEAAALGVPICATPTGIAPYISSQYDGMNLLRPIDEYSADELMQEIINYRNRVPLRFKPFNISNTSRQRLKSTLINCISV